MLPANPSCAWNMVGAGFSRGVLFRRCPRCPSLAFRLTHAPGGDSWVDLGSCHRVCPKGPGFRPQVRNCSLPLAPDLPQVLTIASGPITSWQIEGEENGNSDRLYFLGLQNHCRCDCSHEIKRWLLLGRKAMTNLDSILKSKDITLLQRSV